MNAVASWASWSDFLAMGGYGLYVWGSFGMCAVVLVLEVVLLKLRRRALRDDADGASAGLLKPGGESGA